MEEVKYPQREPAVTLIGSSMISAGSNGEKLCWCIVPSRGELYEASDASSLLH